MSKQCVYICETRRNIYFRERKYICENDKRYIYTKIRNVYTYVNFTRDIYIGEKYIHLKYERYMYIRENKLKDVEILEDQICVCVVCQCSDTFNQWAQAYLSLYVCNSCIPEIHCNMYQCSIVNQNSCRSYQCSTDLLSIKNISTDYSNVQLNCMSIIDTYIHTFSATRILCVIVCV